MNSNPLDSLGLSVGGFISQLVSFGVLLLLLRLFAYKPIMRMLDNRAQKIQESLDAGERAKQEAVNAEKEVVKKTEEASASGQKIVDQAVKAAEDVRRRAEQDARKQADAIIEKARIEIAHEKEESAAELRREVADLAVAVAGKTIGRSLDDMTQKQIIDEALKEAAALGKS
ncbi:MAG: F0F1 ATP synthase subunit B [Dehalococcoidia bacterium]|nr:F0F1 ATP synthase subunit B [Dehalococcoidia bacterium]